MDIFFYFIPFLTILVIVLRKYFHKKWLKIVVVNNNKNKILNFPPSPKGIPIIGNTIVVHRDYEKITELGLKYGGLFSLHLFGTRFVVLNDWKTMKAALIDKNEIFSGRGKLHVMRQITQFNDISMSYGPDWKQKKMEVIQCLRNFGFGKVSIENVIHDEIAKLFHFLDEQNEKPTEITELFFVPVLNVLWIIVAGTTYEHDDEEIKALQQWIQIHLTLLTSTMPVNAIPWLRFVPFDPFGYHKLKRNLRRIQDYLNSTIEEHKKRFHRESQPQDFIDSYLAKNVDNDSTQTGK